MGNKYTANPWSRIRVMGVISLKAQGYGINAHEAVGYNTPSYCVVHDVKVKGNPRVIVNRPAVRKMRSDLSGALLGAMGRPHPYIVAVNYPVLTDGASRFIAPPCPLTVGRGRSSTGSKGGSHPDPLRILRDASVLPARAVDGAEAYLTDPRFNRGASVTLTPSMNIAVILNEAIKGCNA